MSCNKKARTREEWRLAKTFRRDVMLTVLVLALAVGVAFLVEWLMPSMMI